MAGSNRLRPIVNEIRQELAEGRQQLREQHDRGLEGIRVCARFTAMVDAAVSKIYEAYLAEQPEALASELRARSSLVAHGGYGRRQQSPYSDVDLMILYEGQRDSAICQLASRLTQDICDVYQNLGQSLRTTAEAIQLAREDAQIGTSLLESRHVVGNAELFAGYLEQMKAMREKRSQILAKSFIAERRAERLEYGETEYLLEPNVKRSRGGLRDLHLLRWLWYLKCGVAEPDRLFDMGLMSKFDHRRLMNAQNFLLRVRNEMHFDAGETRDALSRAEQLRVAEAFHYLGHEGRLPVEDFMRDYIHHTSHVWRMTHRLSELMQPPPSRISRVLDPVLGRRTEGDYQIGRHEISATPRATTRLAHHREEVLKLVDLARRENKRISQDTWHFIYRTAPRYSSEPRPAVVARFMEMMAGTERLGEALRRLHEMGVLEKIIPAFSHAKMLLQFNQYHKYTVDEHCIRTVEEATHFAERDDILGELYRGLSDKATLHLALLLHDLGKGHEEDHSEVGRRIAVETAQRFVMSPTKAETLEFLVHRHLLMSQLGQRYDTSQPQLVAQFADEVRTSERLDMLFLVTCADLAGVGPDVLNSWKIEVMSELYRNAARRLAPEKDASLVEGNVDREAIKKALNQAERDDPWFERQLAAMPDSFVSRRSPTFVADALRRLRSLEPRSGVAWSSYLPEIGMIEFIAGIDQGGGRAIFSSMAGALTSNRMQILAAETNMLADGLMLIRYVAHVPEEPGPPPPYQLEEINRALVDSIDLNGPPVFPKIRGREQKEAAAALTSAPNEVRVNTTLSEMGTVIEVFTVDRRGLLYRLARSLHDIGLLIGFAKIGTRLDQVVDVFYVTERDGTKPVEESRLNEIREKLLAAVSPE